jgi:hypothetical protein
MYAAGSRALGICDRCGQRAHYPELQPQPIAGRNSGWLVCSQCLDEDHPQLRLGEVRVADYQALRNPRPQTAELEESRRSIGWNPVGNVVMLMQARVGKVTVA